MNLNDSDPAEMEINQHPNNTTCDHDPRRTDHCNLHTHVIDHKNKSPVENGYMVRYSGPLDAVINQTGYPGISGGYLEKPVLKPVLKPAPLSSSDTLTKKQLGRMGVKLRKEHRTLVEAGYIICVSCLFNNQQHLIWNLRQRRAVPQ